MRHIYVAALAAALSVSAAVPAHAQLETDGAAALGVALRRLGTTKRVLMIAAHPDDENTALIAELALGDGADVAYLSLTRGEGGQNLIGPELQEGLGLIRTEELLAARRLDGAHQFFTRAYDYGFSKSADEAFRQWPYDSLLADVVAVIRRYRPDIIVAVFSGTSADGHGQHQASGIMARAALSAAADPTRFPAQLAQGLRPHAARYVFQALYRPPPDPRLRIATGDLDPLFGRSRYQIAMQSRSRHRSQDMGRAEPIGPQITALAVMAGDYPANAASLFAAVDTTLTQRARTARSSAETVAQFARYDERTALARSSYNPLTPLRSLQHLQDNLLLLQSIHLPDDVRFADLRFALAHEIDDAAHAVRLAAGIVTDVVADRRYPVPGESFVLTVTLWYGGTSAPIALERVQPLLPAGWRFDALDDSSAVLQPNRVVRRRFRVHVPHETQPTETYFLRAPRAGAMYRWPANDSVRGQPFDAAPVRVALDVRAGGLLHIIREAEFVDVDKAVGEVRRPLLVLPRASVATSPSVLVLPLDSAARVAVTRTIDVTVRSNSAETLAGVVRLVAPGGWRVEPATFPVTLNAGESRTVRFAVTRPADAAPGTADLRASFDVSSELSFVRGYTLISYPHIRERALYRDATVRVNAFAARLADNMRIGYIEGAGDDGAAALRQLGATVDVLDANALAHADLSRYDAIVAGIRAYEVRPDLLAHNDRVLAYARNGGTFVVQYNKYELVDGNFMPYRATMARPHDRITDEHAQVTLLQPSHPALSWPNRITAADFGGWVHERGLYHLSTFDPRYTPMLAMADPGEEVQQGALVVARIGQGWYVYTGLALFRQFPEGVPGAYRLLANLVSLGRRSITP